MIKVNAILIVLISVKLTYVREHREIHRDKIAPYSLLSLPILRELVHSLRMREHYLKTLLILR